MNNVAFILDLDNYWIECIFMHLPPTSCVTNQSIELSKMRAPNPERLGKSSCGALYSINWLWCYVFG